MGCDDHTLISELEGKVVGMAGIHLLKSARQRHSAFIGIMVGTEYQGQGIGRNLMENILDLADNWLMLVRIEIDGTKKYAVIKDGKYADLLMMARYNVPTQFK